MLFLTSACASASYICVGWKPCLCSACIIWLLESPCACMLATCEIGTSDGIGGAIIPCCPIIPGAPIGCIPGGIISAPGMPGCGVFFLKMSIIAILFNSFCV